MMATPFHFPPFPFFKIFPFLDHRQSDRRRGRDDKKIQRFFSIFY